MTRTRFNVFMLGAMVLPFAFSAILGATRGSLTNVFWPPTWPLPAQVIAAMWWTYCLGGVLVGNLED